MPGNRTPIRNPTVDNIGDENANTQPVTNPAANWSFARTISPSTEDPVTESQGHHPDPSPHTHPMDVPSSDVLQSALTMTDPDIRGEAHSVLTNLAVIIKAIRTVWRQAQAGSIDELFTVKNPRFSPAQNVIHSETMIHIWLGFLSGYDTADLALRLIDRLVLELNRTYHQPLEAFRISEQLIDTMDARAQLWREMNHPDYVRRNEGQMADRAAELDRRFRTFFDELDYPSTWTQITLPQLAPNDSAFLIEKQAERSTARQSPSHHKLLYEDLTSAFATLSVEIDYYSAFLEIAENINERIKAENTRQGHDPEAGLIDASMLQSQIRNINEDDEDIHAELCRAGFRAYLVRKNLPTVWATFPHHRIIGSMTPPEGTVGDLHPPSNAQTSSTTGQGSSEQNTANVGNETAQRIPEHSATDLIGPASVPPGYTAEGKKIMAWRKQGYGKQCIVEDGPPGNRTYSIIGSAACGGIEVVQKAVDTGLVPQLGSSDAELLALRKSSQLQFQGIASTALVGYRRPAEERCKLPVTFFWVLWTGHSPCWISRTVLARLIGISVYGDKALFQRMEELGMKMPSGDRPVRDSRAATQGSEYPIVFR